MIITKWFIRRTPETASQINKWFTGVTGKIYCSTNDWHPNLGRQEPHWTYLHYPPIKTNSPQGRGVYKKPREGYVEITFREFRRYILRKRFIKSKWKKEPNFVVDRNCDAQSLVSYSNDPLYFR